MNIVRSEKEKEKHRLVTPTTYERGRNAFYAHVSKRVRSELPVMIKWNKYLILFCVFSKYGFRYGSWCCICICD